MIISLISIPFPIFFFSAYTTTYFSTLHFVFSMNHHFSNGMQLRAITQHMSSCLKTCSLCLSGRCLLVRHANIVQRVKTCYKIKIDYRVPVCCFCGVLLSKQHQQLTIEPLLHSDSATIRVQKRLYCMIKVDLQECKRGSIAEKSSSVTTLIS